MFKAVAATLGVFLALFLSPLFLFTRGGPGYSRTVATADQDMKTIANSLEQYMNLAGFYPTNEQGLKALFEEPKTEPLPGRWVQLVNSMDDLYDPWETPYRYLFPGTNDPNRPEIISAGPDKTFGTDDDQSNQD